MGMTTKEIDLLAEATNGKHHWNDPGMDDFEKGYEDFLLGVRVEVRVENGWLKGTVVETLKENDRGIVVKTDEKWHDNLNFYEGHGATILICMNTRRGILSNIRLIDEPREKVIIPRKEPSKLEGRRAELLKIAEIAVEFSQGKLRIAYNEDDETDEFTGSAARFLKLDGKRLGRDIELYGFMGDGPTGWKATLAMFLEEVILPLKKNVLQSYVAAGEELRILGKSVYPEDLLGEWNKLFN